MALLTEYVEMDELSTGLIRHTLHMKQIAYREAGSLFRMNQNWEDSGDSDRPHLVERAPIMVTAGDDGMRRIHPTRELDRYIEIGAPFVKTGGVWGKVNLGIPVRNGLRLTWSRPQADMVIDFGGHFIKLAIYLKNGFVPEDNQIAFPVGLTGFTRSGLNLLRDGVVIAALQKPIIQDAANSYLGIPITNTITNLNGQPYWLMTLPSLVGVSQPIIDPTLSLQPDASAGIDTMLDNGATTSNYGVRTTTAIGETNTAEVRAHRCLIRFDLSSIPQRATVTSATLSMFCNADFSSNARVFSVYRMKRVWTEGTGNGTATGDGATWATYNGVTAWQTAGGTGANDRDVAIGSRSFTATETLNVFKDFTLTPTTKFGLDYGLQNGLGATGWMIAAATESADRYDFDLSDSATAAQRPTVTFIYKVPPRESIGRGAFVGVGRGRR